MRVGDAMGPAIATVEMRTPIEDVADLMRSLHCDVLPVDDDGSFAGLITANDVLLALVSPPVADGTGLSQTMRGAPVHDRAMISSDATIDEAVRRMAELHVDHLGVVEEGSVVGILRLADLAPALRGPRTSIRIRTVHLTQGARARMTALLARAGAWLDDRRATGDRTTA